MKYFHPKAFFSGVLFLAILTVIFIKPTTADAQYYGGGYYGGYSSYGYYGGYSGCCYGGGYGYAYINPYGSPVGNSYGYGYTPYVTYYAAPSYTYYPSYQGGGYGYGGHHGRR